MYQATKKSTRIVVSSKIITTRIVVSRKIITTRIVVFRMYK